MKTVKYSGTIRSADIREQSFKVWSDDSLLTPEKTLYADTALFWDIMAVAAKTHSAHCMFHIQGRVIKHFENTAWREEKEIHHGRIAYQSQNYQHPKLHEYNGTKVLVQPQGKRLVVRSTSGDFICLADPISSSGKGGAA
jgi:hypothetical protein